MTQPRIEPTKRPLQRAGRTFRCGCRFPTLWKLLSYTKVSCTHLSTLCFCIVFLFLSPLTTADANRVEVEKSLLGDSCVDQSASQAAPNPLSALDETPHPIIAHSYPYYAAMHALESRDYETAYSHIKECASYDIRCLSILGEYFFLGRPPLKAKWLSDALLAWKVAADKGSADAQFYLAMVYSNFFNLPNIHHNFNPRPPLPSLSSLIEVVPETKSLNTFRLERTYSVDELLQYELNLRKDILPDKFAKSESLAITYLYAAALAGHPGALTSLAYRYQHGYGVYKSCSTASLYYLELAKRVSQAYSSGVPQALDLIFLELPGVRYSHKPHQLHLVLHEAEQGDPLMQASIAKGYLFGVHGLEQSYSKAYEYFSRAAASNDKESMAFLGYLFALGTGVSKDLDIAAAWFERSVAADVPEPLGTNGLGYIYFFGTSKYPRNHTKAFEYFNASAYANIPDAQYNLACMYMAGKGVEKSLANAVNWFSSALVSGHTPATFVLALVQLNGMATTASDCNLVVSLLKRVSTNGSWVTHSLKKANIFLVENNMDEYLFQLWKVAESGDERSQANFAYTIEKEGNLFFTSKPALRRMYATRFLYMAADQNYIPALLKLGDFAYYGYGLQNHDAMTRTTDNVVDTEGNDVSEFITVPNSWISRNEVNYWDAYEIYRGILKHASKEKWLAHYKIRAAYNIGLMLAFGLGVKQNFNAAREELASAFQLDSSQPLTQIHLLLLFLNLYEKYQTFTWTRIVETQAFYKLSGILVTIVAVFLCYELRKWLSKQIQQET